MKCLTYGEFSFQVIEKTEGNGLTFKSRFFGQVFEVESLNLIFETECYSRTGAEQALGDWLADYLSKQ